MIIEMAIHLMVLEIRRKIRLPPDMVMLVDGFYTDRVAAGRAYPRREAAQEMLDGHEIEVLAGKLDRVPFIVHAELRKVMSLMLDQMFGDAQHLHRHRSVLRTEAVVASRKSLRVHHVEAAKEERAGRRALPEHGKVLVNVNVSRHNVAVLEIAVYLPRIKGPDTRQIRARDEETTRLVRFLDAADHRRQLREVVARPSQEFLNVRISDGLMRAGEHGASLVSFEDTKAQKLLELARVRKRNGRRRRRLPLEVLGPV